MENYFEILGVAPDASDKEVKAKYRELIKKYHPDVNKDNEEYATEMTAKINEAYSVLATEEGRQNYQYVLQHQNRVANAREYPTSFVISDFEDNSYMSAEVYFGDSAVGFLYELITGMNLQQFISSLGSQRNIDFSAFKEIYNSPQAVENRRKSILGIVNPSGTGDENMRKIYSYMRRLIAQAMRTYNYRETDRIFKHIHWCEYMFCNQLTEETGMDILKLEGMQKAEFQTFEFNLDDLEGSIKHYRLKKALFIVTAVVVIVAVVVVLLFLLFNVFIIGAVVFAFLAIAGFIYKLINGWNR
jgi:curved DNA-binding protein CbpA